MCLCVELFLSADPFAGASVWDHSPYPPRDRKLVSEHGPSMKQDLVNLKNMLPKIPFQNCKRRPFPQMSSLQGCSENAPISKDQLASKMLRKRAPETPTLKKTISTHRNTHQKRAQETINITWFHKSARFKNTQKTCAGHTLNNLFPHVSSLQ